MRVRVIELKEAFDRITEMLIDSGVDDVELEASGYWAVSIEDVFSVYKETPSLIFGDLESDLDALRKVAAASTEASMMDARAMAAVLMYLVAAGTNQIQVEKKH